MSFRRVNFERNLNASLIVIFTKKEGTSSIGDYKPISLVGSIYKIISKVLYNRLKRVLDETICLCKMLLLMEGRFWM
uniref:Putative ovule protein n=1 Tax=Solanum chacoense TaxID=4108 RepID=A0A0V0HJ28_SOLCH